MTFWGCYQRFEFGALSLELSLTENHYRVTDGNSMIERIGYDRIPDPELRTGMFYSYMGQSHMEGPAHPTPYAFSWELQNLTHDQYRLLSAIIKRSHQEKSPIRLYDALISLDERAPRTRAKVGSYSQPIHGMEWFFPVFDVWIDLPEAHGVVLGKHQFRLSGLEWNPKTPIPITEDAAA